ncbi:Neurotrypsin [Holothuria leucospilota]|uniref:Neurotrypsin n=1 Tax=Holothuria leucospilota TaxID=206669 RepID=A0A9Q1BXV1_HOLLE|nr:Neurotrypsin [Holothuria leucospilota]
MDDVGGNIPSKKDNWVHVTLTRKVPVAQSPDGVEIVLTIVHVTVASTIVPRKLFSDLERGVRSDGRCGSQYPLSDGQPGKCDPDSHKSCCSPNGLCGYGRDYCRCDGCIDFRDLERGVRSDGRCGSKFPLTNGQPGKCDPVSENSCCSPNGWCGYSPDDCTCDRCIDHRAIASEKSLQDVRLVDGYSNSSGRVEVLIGEMWTYVCVDTENVFQDVRLAEGYSNSSGRVEVLIDVDWAPVCTDGWTLVDAGVACRQLGYQTVIAAFVLPSLNYLLGPYWADHVNCSGNETSLFQCKQIQNWQDDRSFWGEAWVVCGVNRENLIQNLRLVEGPSNSSGRLEVFFNNEWGTICDNGWDLVDATVACREIGYRVALFTHRQAFSGKGSGFIWLTNVQCNGNESSLTECKHEIFAEPQCSHHQDVGVLCGELQLGVRYDGRCGFQYPLLNGQPSKCDRDSKSSCCSKHGWCGNGPDYCTCDGCIDFRERWVRSDGRCGPQYPFTNGQPGECDPDSEWSCCSESGWCGNSTDNCTCDGCIDYRDLERGVRGDGLCGPEFPLTNGQPGKCDPESEDFCCSPYGRCGNTTKHCKCYRCLDYRDCFGFVSTSLLRIYVTDRRGGTEKHGGEYQQDHLSRTPPSVGAERTRKFLALQTLQMAGNGTPRVFSAACVQP